MNRLFPYLILACALVPLGAQEMSSPARETGDVEVVSDVFDGKLAEGIAVWRGNVHVNDPQMELTCDYLTAKMPPAGGGLNVIIAETNVVIRLHDKELGLITAKGDKMVYTAATRLVEISADPGPAIIETPQATMWGPVFILDQDKHTLRSNSQRGKVRTVLKAGALNFGTSSNSATKLGVPGAPVAPSGAVSKVPPKP